MRWIVAALIAAIVVAGGAYVAMWAASDPGRHGDGRARAETEVWEALERLMEGRSTLVIAHRLSTIAGVDKIVALQNGRVVEEGPPDVLARAGGMYAELLALQDSTVSNLEMLRRFELAAPDEDEDEAG